MRACHRARPVRQRLMGRLRCFAAPLHASTQFSAAAHDVDGSARRAAANHRCRAIAASSPKRVCAMALATPGCRAGQRAGVAGTAQSVRWSIVSHMPACVTLHALSKRSATRAMCDSAAVFGQQPSIPAPAVPPGRCASARECTNPVLLPLMGAVQPLSSWRVLVPVTVSKCPGRAQERRGGRVGRAGSVRPSLPGSGAVGSALSISVPVLRIEGSRRPITWRRYLVSTPPKTANPLIHPAG